MASQSEVGHAKNVANFEQVITLLQQLGDRYNPPKEELTMPSLQQKLADAKASTQAVSMALVNYQQAVDAKKEVYENVRRTSSRVLNMFKASAGDDKMVESLTSLVRKIRGNSPVKKAPVVVENAAAAETKEPRTRSVSQQSFTMVTENFQQVTDLLRIVPGYTPKEADLQLAGLEELLLDMKTKGQAAVTAEANLHTARTQRNNSLYAEKIGLVSTVTGIKKYVSASFTASDPGYRQISKIVFRTA